MTDRYSKRARYIDGWYELDTLKLMDSTRDDFLFDDPKEPAPVVRENLGEYMLRWDNWTRKVGANNEWKLSYEVREDKNGVLTDWEWWELIGTEISGSALVQTSDEGVFLERITYFDRNKSG